MEYSGTPEPPVLRYSSRGSRTRWCSVGMLFLRCSASEGGGTAQYASRLIGEREVVRVARSQSRSSGPTFGSGHDTKRAERTDHDGARGHGHGDRAAGGSHGVAEVCFPAGVDAGGISGLQDRDGRGAEARPAASPSLIAMDSVRRQWLGHCRPSRGIRVAERLMGQCTGTCRDHQHDCGLPG